jgi:hypothetical protein
MSQNLSALSGAVLKIIPPPTCDEAQILRARPLGRGSDEDAMAYREARGGDEGSTAIGISKPSFFVSGDARNGCYVLGRAGDWQRQATSSMSTQDEPSARSFVAALPRNCGARSAAATPCSSYPRCPQGSELQRSRISSTAAAAAASGAYTTCVVPPRWALSSAARPRRRGR